MTLKIVIVNGVAEHGKDTFVGFIKKNFNGTVINHSTVATVKEASKFFGADEAKQKGDKERRLWSDLKDAYTRYCDGPFREIVELVESIRWSKKQGDRILIFVHAREPAEIEKVANRYPMDCVTVLVRGAKSHVPDNHADMGVEDYAYDVYVENVGTLDDLEESAKVFIENVLL